MTILLQRKHNNSNLDTHNFFLFFYFFFANRSHGRGTQHIHKKERRKKGTFTFLTYTLRFCITWFILSDLPTAVWGPVFWFWLFFLTTDYVV